ncbi:hypothetical protein [Methylocucumis oryzae]|uniref:hypothetical protein n=1 Tax=Methylocucumis oryzae TaxID=1632867 RepID=UPI000ABDCCF7
MFPGSDFVLITNGSLIHQPRVRLGLEELHRQHGQVWFKFDSATEQGRKRINNTAQSVRSALTNLVIASELCTTKLQTCLVDYDGQGLSVIEKSAYLTALASIKNECNVQDIMLYTIARPSMQPEAKLLKPLSYEVLAAFADEIRQLGFDVSVCV